ncbi:hypothetical protein QTO34_014551 [Cnephaeus nilssonii]|uniref:Mucin-20 n=1 Tax=Cnephaeus nilssonii TaxID=3371016 RepID=A0AA40LU62_CNENI|nr:hypothetical protein QTO34_014551 [Eptesicus nilssonii]
MGSLWALALPLLLCCWEAGAPGSSAGKRAGGSCGLLSWQRSGCAFLSRQPLWQCPGHNRESSCEVSPLGLMAHKVVLPNTGSSTHGPSPLVTMNHTEVPAVTLGVNTSLEGASKTTHLAQAYVPSHTPLETQTWGTQTFDKTVLPASTISEAKIRETQTRPGPHKNNPFQVHVCGHYFYGDISHKGQPPGTGMTTVETVTDSGLLEAVFDTLCTDDSSEEKRITIDALTYAHSSAEARALALESNSAPDITPQAQEPDITVPPKALVAYRITNIEATNCNIIEIEETAILPGTSDLDHSPTGRKTPSTPETSALPDLTKAKPHLTRATTPSEALSTDSTTESAETPHTANRLTGETTAAEATTPSGALVTVSMNPLEESSAPSVETTSHSEVLGAVPISTEAGSTVGRATSCAESSAIGYSLSAVATIKESTRSETSTTDSTASGTVPISRSPLPAVHPAAANSSQETDITLAKTTASAKTSRIASMAGGKSPTATPTTAQTTGLLQVREYPGFLLLRLRVASPEDLTDPRVAERLMHQGHGFTRIQGPRASPGSRGTRPRPDPGFSFIRTQGRMASPGPRGAWPLPDPGSRGLTRIQGPTASPGPGTQAHPDPGAHGLTQTRGQAHPDPGAHGLTRTRGQAHPDPGAHGLTRTRGQAHPDPGAHGLTRTRGQAHPDPGAHGLTRTRDPGL